jgi:hypothetical protein
LLAHSTATEQVEPPPFLATQDPLPSQYEVPVQDEASCARVTVTLQAPVLLQFRQVPQAAEQQ